MLFNTFLKDCRLVLDDQGLFALTLDPVEGIALHCSAAPCIIQKASIERVLRYFAQQVLDRDFFTN